MGKTRRVAERMIVERAERTRRIADDLRSIAVLLESREGGDSLNAESARLRALANDVERL